MSDPVQSYVGPYQTFDISETQDVHFQVQQLSLNLQHKRRFLAEAEEAYQGKAGRPARWARRPSSRLSNICTTSRATGSRPSWTRSPRD